MKCKIKGDHSVWECIDILEELEKQYQAKNGRITFNGNDSIYLPEYITLREMRGLWWKKEKK